MYFLTDPVVALFASLAIGYLIGRLRIGPVRLGGVCGTLLAALAIGQLGVRISPDLKDSAFTLFIYALGFTAGPQFFANIQGGWRYGIFSIIEVVCVTLLVSIAIILFKLDIGTATGLFAGSATESAAIGTASQTISRLPISPEEIEQLQANVATAYSLTYLFGLLAIVVFTTQLAPILLKVDLKTEAQALARKLDSEDEDDDQVEGLPMFVARAFRAGSLGGLTVGDLEKGWNWTVTIERVRRHKKIVQTDPAFLLKPDDIVIVHGRRNAVIAIQDSFGDEVPVPDGTSLALVTREVVLIRADAFGRQIRQLRHSASPELRRGVFISNIRRLGQNIPALPGTVLHEGDVLTLYGQEEVVTRAVHALGKPLPKVASTDFVFLGLGIVAGLLLGNFSLNIRGWELTLGSGGGALIAGLVFGWLNMRNPARGGFPVPAAEFAKDFGLATFIAAIGLSAGPEAIDLVLQYGLILPILGLIVSFVPALVSLFVGAKLMKIETPILLGAIAGQHCSTPTISALVSQAGNSTPVIGYTVTYAISNVLLPLMGPMIVGIAAALGS